MSPLPRPSQPLLLLSVLAAVGLAAAASLPATGNSGGAAQFAEQGCTCHGENARPGPPPIGADGQPSQDTVVALAGDLVTAEVFDWGASYDLQVSVTSTGVTPMPNRANTAGFALLASAGTLAAVDDSVSAEGAAASHTAAGNDQSVWTVNWTAPPAGTILANGTVIFTLSGNFVNGDGNSGFLDHWNQEFYTIASGDAPVPTNTTGDGNETEEDNGSPGIGIPVALGGLLLAWLVIRRKERDE